MANNRNLSIKLYNAKSEDLVNKVSFKRALSSRRCLVPANGYYQWKRVSKKGRTPYWISIPEEPVFSMAAIWDEFEDESGEVQHTFRVITVSDNGLVGMTENDMPAIFNTGEEKQWLDQSQPTDELVKLVRPYSSGKMKSHSVSNRVNNPELEGAELIAHVPPTDQFGNYSLFS